MQELSHISNYPQDLKLEIVSYTNLPRFSLQHPVVCLSLFCCCSYVDREILLRFLRLISGRAGVAKNFVFIINTNYSKRYSLQRCNLVAIALQLTLQCYSWRCNTLSFHRLGEIHCCAVCYSPILHSRGCFSLIYIIYYPI